MCKLKRMHKLEGTYSDGNCGVYLHGGEPYVLINLEKFYGQNPKIRGPHCDFVYICFKDGEWNVFVVELKDIQNVEDEDVKKEIRKSFQGKFSQTLSILGTQILSFFNVRCKIKHKARIVVPYEVLNIIGSLIKKDTTLMGELKLFDDAGLVQCYGDIWKPDIHLKREL